MHLRSPRVDTSLLAVLAEGFLSRLSFGLIGFALPLYAYYLGMSISAIGVLISLNIVTEMALKPLVAPLADRFGPKASLGFAVALRSVVALLLAFAVAPWQLYGIRILHGVSESMRDPAVNVIISERGGKKTIASSFAWYNTAKVVAGALGKSAAGVFLSLTLSNYRMVFLGAFILSFLPFFVVVRYVKDMDPHGGPVEAPGRAAVAGPPAGGDETAARKPAVLAAFGFGIMMSGTAAMLGNLFPLLATQYAGLTEAEAGIVYGASICVILFAGPLFGWLSDNFSRKLVLLTRSIANIISSFLYIAFPSFGGVLTAKIIDDCGKAAFRPGWGALMAHIASFDRAHRARVIGYMGLAENIGETGGPLLAGFLWNTWGITVVLLVRAALAVVTEIYSVFAMRSIEANPSEAPSGDMDTIGPAAALLTERPLAGEEEEGL